MTFKSETDTEVIVQLIEKFVNKGADVLEEHFVKHLTITKRIICACFIR